MKALPKEFMLRIFLGVAICLFIVSNVSYAKIMGGSTTGIITKPTTLKVVVVQFADVKWDKYWD